MLEIKQHKKLQENDLNALSQLAVACQTHDGFLVTLYWDLLKKTRSQPLDFFVYDKNDLIGYVGAFLFYDDALEVNAIIHPNYRQQGVFSSCLKHIKTIAKEKLAISKLLFTCPDQSYSGNILMKKIGAQASSTENTLQLLLKQMTDISLHPSYALQTATLNDCETLAKMDAACFNSSPRLMQQRFKTIIDDTNRKHWLFVYNGKVIGKSHARLEGQVATLHDLGILPEQQHQGHGNQMLQATLQYLKLAGIVQVKLTVTNNNHAAMALYKKAGFQIINTENSYALAF